MEEIIKQFFNFGSVMLFLISWKNFFIRLFQEIRKREEEAQKEYGSNNIQINSLIQFKLKFEDVEGSKIEKRLFIIKIYN